MADNVTLMAIDANFAVFAVVNAPNKNVLHHTTGPFMYINQFKHCAELIRMPIESFLKLADEVGDPLAKLVILSNTGRCGSTLLTQLFEELPNTVAISEPEVLMAFTHESTFDDEHYNRRAQLLQACIRLLCKNHRTDETRCICIKPKAHAIALTKEIYDLYPQSKHLFLYRHPAEYVRSLISVYKSLLHPVARGLLMYFSFDFDMTEFIMRQFADPQGQYQSIYESKMLETIKSINLKNRVNRFTALFCGNLLAMLQLAKEEKIPMLVVSYHELKVKEETDAEMKRILKHCGVESILGVNGEVTLPENDSQNNSGLSRRHLQSFREAMTEKELGQIDVILRQCGFPACENFPLESAGLVKELDLK